MSSIDRSILDGKTLSKGKVTPSIFVPELTLEDPSKKRENYFRRQFKDITEFKTKGIQSKPRTTTSEINTYASDKNKPINTKYTEMTEYTFRTNKEEEEVALADKYRQLNTAYIQLMEELEFINVDMATLVQKFDETGFAEKLSTEDKNYISLLTDIYQKREQEVSRKLPDRLTDAECRELQSKNLDLQSKCKDELQKRDLEIRTIQDDLKEKEQTIKLISEKTPLSERNSLADCNIREQTLRGEKDKCENKYIRLEKVVDAYIPVLENAATKLRTLTKGLDETIPLNKSFLDIIDTVFGNEFDNLLQAV